MSTFALKTSGTEKDVALADPPTDSISALAWSPAADFLAAASWSNEVRVYEVGDKGANKGVAMYRHDAPALDVCWSKDGGKIVSGGADNAVRLYDAATAQSTQIGVHDAPVKCVRWVDAAGGLVCSGSWDKTLRYWDLRQSTPVAQVSLPERCYAMDCVFPLLVAATAGQHVLIFNLNNPTVPFKTVTSPLKQQTRTLSPTGPATRSRRPKGAWGSSTSTRRERRPTLVSSATGATCRRARRARLALSGRRQVKPSMRSTSSRSTTSGRSLRSGRTAGLGFGTTSARRASRRSSRTSDPSLPPSSAARASYDWHAGYMGNTPQQQTKIMLHACEPEEVKPKPKKT